MMKAKFSTSFLEKLARRMTGDNSAMILDYLLEPYSEEKLGVASSHFRLTLCLEDTAKKSAFVKYSPELKLPADELITYKDVFNQEVFFYGTILPRLVRVSRAAEKCCPDIYVAEEENIVMQDLRQIGYKVQRNIKDKHEYLSSALRTIARLHGSSLLAERDPQDPVQWETYLKRNGVKERIFTDDLKAGKFVKRSLELVEDLSCSLGFTDSSAIKSAFTEASNLLQLSTDFLCGLSHGHLDRRNMLFSNDGGKVKCLLIDFQTYRYAPVISDVVHLIYLNTTKRYRDNSENVDKLLVDYHTELNKVMQSGRNQRIQSPLLDQIRFDFDKFKLYGLVIASIYKPTEAMYRNDKRIFNNQDEWQKFVFENSRKTEVSRAMKEDKIFEESINETITELFEYINKSDY